MNGWMTNFKSRTLNQPLRSTDIYNLYIGAFIVLKFCGKCDSQEGESCDKSRLWAGSWDCEIESSNPPEPGHHHHLNNEWMWMRQTCTKCHTSNKLPTISLQMMSFHKKKLNLRTRTIRKSERSCTCRRLLRYRWWWGPWRPSLSGRTPKVPERHLCPPGPSLNIRGAPTTSWWFCSDGRRDHIEIPLDGDTRWREMDTSSFSSKL